MVHPKPINALVVLVLIPFVKCAFTPLGDWLLYRPDSANPITAIQNLQNGGSPSITSTSSSMDSKVKCYQTTLDRTSWSLTTDYSSLISGLDEFTIGFWVTYLSATSTKIFQFGSENGPHYVVSSNKAAVFKVSFYKDASTKDDANDFSIPVPWGSWFFIAFDFVNVGGTVTLNILVSGVAKYSNTNKAGSTAPFELPDGYLAFGQNTYSGYYEIILASSATISDDFNTITFKDNGSNSYVVAKPCNADTCDGDLCPGDGSCFNSKGNCLSCSSGSCTDCDSDNTGRDTVNYCQTCLSGYSMKQGNCNFYLGCINANNCDSCSDPRICDSCPADHFRWKKDGDTISCICNFYVACTDSCDQCLPGPICYECADSIVQERKTCKVLKLGYQVSFEAPNIIINFAIYLYFDLKKSSFKAKSSTTGAVITTDNWILNGCKIYSSQCIIVTDNVNESDLPIDLEIAFEEIFD